MCCNSSFKALQRALSISLLQVRQICSRNRKILFVFHAPSYAPFTSTTIFVYHAAHSASASSKVTSFSLKLWHLKSSNRTYFDIRKQFGTNTNTQYALTGTSFALVLYLYSTHTHTYNNFERSATTRQEQWIFFLIRQKLLHILRANS